MSQREDVAAIVLNYNGGTMVLNCLRAILSGSVVPKIYLIDNASTDNSLHQLMACFPDMTVIKNHTNLGFSAGMNVGIRRALSDGMQYIWLVNNDAIVEKRTLQELLKVAERYPEHGLWSPAIYSFQGNIPWFLGGDISYFSMRTIHWTKRKKQQDFFSSNFVTGCALLLSRSVIECCGLLDERYFLYYEDAAYSLAARRKGFFPTVVFSSRVQHAEKSKENPQKIYWLVRSGIQFFDRESPWYWKPWITFYFSLRRFKNALQLLMAPHPIAREVKRAYTDALRERHE